MTSGAMMISILHITISLVMEVTREDMVADPMVVPDKSKACMVNLTKDMGCLPGALMISTQHLPQMLVGMASRLIRFLGEKPQ